MLLTVIIPAALAGFLAGLTANYSRRDHRSRAPQRGFAEVVLETMSDSLFTIGLDGRLDSANHAALVTLGYSSDEIRGMAARQVLPASTCDALFPETAGEAVMAASLFRDAETILRTKGGADLPVSLSANLMRDSGGEVHGLICIARDITERRMMAQERERLITKLETALNDVKTLQGLLPICSWCKKVKDDKGYWNRLETYLEEHSQAELTHGLCPDCYEKLYSEIPDHPAGEPNRDAAPPPA